jgi:hypothetical protein
MYLTLIQTKQSQAKAALSTNKHGIYAITDELRFFFCISTANVSLGQIQVTGGICL